MDIIDFFVFPRPFVVFHEDNLNINAGGAGRRIAIPSAISVDGATETFSPKFRTEPTHKSSSQTTRQQQKTCSSFSSIIVLKHFLLFFFLHSPSSFFPLHSRSLNLDQFYVDFFSIFFLFKEILFI